MHINLQNAALEWLLRTAEKIEDIFAIRVIRNGMVTMTPLLLLGTFSLLLLTFPLEAYHVFITEAADGFLYNIFHMVYQASFGIISFYMVLCLSVSYFNLKAPEQPVSIWGISAALASFLIMSGVWSNSFKLGDLGSSSVFLSIITALASSEIFYLTSQRYAQKQSLYKYSADSSLGSSMGALLPAAVTVSVFALLAFAVTLLGYPTLHDLLKDALLAFFAGIGDLFAKGLYYVLAEHLLWLGGIHGGWYLDSVSYHCFAPSAQHNMEAVAKYGWPAQILCKNFFFDFVRMGGCGSCISLVLAILLFAKNKGMRLLSKVAGLPLLFNINELIIFGLPVVFSPVLAIPFLLVPVLNYLVAYYAMSEGLVPPITVDVSWTTPVLVSGYVATESLAGLLLQLVNIVLGVAVYAPFVKLLERVKATHEDANRENFIKWFIANEGKNPQLQLLGMHGIYGDIAHKMALELKQGIRQERFELYYQPQYGYDGKCMGVEALLRWPKDKWLSTYPPLLVQLAKEQDLLLDMEKMILQRGMAQRERVFRQFGHGIKISVNVTGNSAACKEYWDYLRKLWEEQPFTEGTLCIEVTEQDAIDFNAEILAQFRSCRELGIKFAIDDFSAGNTSLEYLKNGIFDMLKLDGALVRAINDNQRCREIIASLVALTNSLHIACLAEFVENEAIREALHEAGCDLYQGYLYSPAVPLQEENTEKS